MIPPPPVSTLFPYTTLFRSGLGEVAVGADAHHVEGLQNEVDVVLLVKRAMGDEAYWGESDARSEEHTSELQSRPHLVCRLLLEKKKTKPPPPTISNSSLQQP